MNLEELTKHQIVLLTLLVSFVTSIATGIVTVSLMDYAPPTVTKTVNQIIERTVERVVPPNPEELPQVAAAVTPEIIEKVTVIEKGTSLESAIATVSEGLIRLFEIREDERVFLGYGLIMTSDGLAVGPLSGVTEKYLEAEDMKGNSFEVQKVHTGSTFGYYKLITSGKLSPAPVSPYASLVLGQNIYALSGGSSMALASGLITGSPQSDQASSSVRIIETNIPVSSPNIVLFGDKGTIFGLAGNINGSWAFISIDTIKDVIAQIK